MTLRTPLYLLLLAIPLLACDRQAAPETAAASATPAAPPPTAGPAAPPSAPTPSVPASDGDALADLDAMAVADLAQDSPAMQAYLGRHFKDQCVPGEDPLSFAQTCQHYGEEREDDPSPWPELVIGFANGRAASLVLTDSARSVELPWQCQPAEGFDGMRFCFTEDVSADDRKRWTGEWSAFFSAGG